MSLNEQQQTVLNLICSEGGGIDIHDLMNNSGLSYPEINHIARELISKGYMIRAISVGGYLKRLFLSPYDKNYENLIKN
jgi:hypothetical protein